MAAKTATLPTISRTACSGDTAAAGAAAGAGNCAGVVTGTWEAGSGGSAIAMWQDFREQLGRRQQTSLISQAAATPILQGCGAKTATAGSGPASALRLFRRRLQLQPAVLHLGDRLLHLAEDRKSTRLNSSH